MGSSGPSPEVNLRGQISRSKENIRRGDVAVQASEKEKGSQRPEAAS